MSGFVPHHLSIDEAALAGNGGLGRYVLVPGSDARARLIAERFEDRRDYPCPRQHNVYTGVIRGADGASVDVAAVSTGMGAGSVEIVVTELILLGARRFLRVGTCGSLQPAHIRVGHQVIATASVRDEHMSDAYAPRGYPAVAHPHWVAALEGAARAQGVADKTWAGIVHTKAALYAREMGLGPMAASHHNYMESLHALGVLATEMETSALFVLAAAHDRAVASIDDRAATAQAVKAGGILAVVGDDEAFADAERTRAAEALAIELGLTAALELAAIEGVSGR